MKASSIVLGANLAGVAIYRYGQRRAIRPAEGHRDAVNTNMTQTAQTALLALDAQTVIVEPAPASFFLAMRRALDAAHEAGIQVIYIRVELRPGNAGVSPRNKRLTRLQPVLQRGAAGLEIHPSLVPEERDIVLTKHRVSSFVGSGLEVVLSSLGITHLVLAGVSTSTAVLGTAMAAADMDFGLQVLSDACFDTRTETHDRLIADVFPAMATVLRAEEWAASLAELRSSTLLDTSR